MSDRNDTPQPNFAAFVGIDWGDKKHAWALQVKGSSQIEKGELEHTPEAVHDWAGALRQRFGGACIAVALEQSRGALVFMLSKYEHLVLYPIHPSSAADYRKIFRPSGAKSDGPDADLLLDFLLRHPDRLRPLQPDTELTRTLQLLVEGRRQLVDERKRLSNRLRADLKSYYPQVLLWFEDPTAAVVLDLLERWPTLPELQKARPATLLHFFQQHRCRDAGKNQARLKSIQTSVVATTDGAVTTAGTMAVKSTVRLLRYLNDSIAEYDRRIEALAEKHPDFAIFDSLPGAGPVLVPRLIAAFGTQRERYPNAAALQQYSGVAPVTEASGQQRWVHWRWSCPKFLRQTFQEWAEQSIRYCDWAAAYYRAQRDHKNQSHQTAIRSLAYKWIRIVFRCWKDHMPYVDSRYEAALLRRRDRPSAPNTLLASIQWTSCGSFQKIALKNQAEALT